MLKLLQQRLFTTRLVRRGALDIGSGSIKCAVADIKNNKIINRVYNSNEEVLSMKNYQDNGYLSTSIIEKETRVINDFHLKMRALEVETIHAVATEVFRKSPNGVDAVQQFENIIGCKIPIITPEEEAGLAFQGAVATSGLDPATLIVWDCGAGSFQVKSNANVYFDSWGSGTIYKEAKNIQNPINPFGA